MLKIILPVHNREEITKKFLDRLHGQTFKDFHVILVDDGSTDNTEKVAQEAWFPLTILKGDGSLWWAGSLKKAFDYIIDQGKNVPVLIINDDTIISDNFLELGLKSLEQMPGALICAQARDKDGNIKDTGVRIDWASFKFEKANSPDEINCLSTRGLFLNVDTYEKVGGFKPEFLPHYCSDYEFTHRAHTRGIKLVSAPNLILTLMEDKTGNRSYKNMSIREVLRQLFSLRNALNPWTLTKFIMISCPPQYKIINILRVLKITIKAIWKAIRKDLKNI